MLYQESRDDPESLNVIDTVSANGSHADGPVARQAAFKITQNSHLVNRSETEAHQLTNGTPLQLSNGMLTPIDARFERAWLAGLSHVINQREAIICRISRNLPSKHVLILPVPHAQLACVKVESSLLCPPDVICAYGQLYQLTAAERSVLSLLTDGNEPKRVSIIKGTAESTVRTQIKNILAKTDESSIRQLLITLGKIAVAGAERA